MLSVLLNSTFFNKLNLLKTIILKITILLTTTPKAKLKHIFNVILVRFIVKTIKMKFFLHGL